MAEYAEITDPQLQERVRARYRNEIAVLRSLGFRQLACGLEALGPYSVILRFPILLLAYGREVLVFLRPLRLAVANALLFHTEPHAIALCMGMGVKIYSAFEDRTVLISSSFETHLKPRPGSSIVRLSAFPSIEKAWEVHRDQVSARVAQGNVALTEVAFRDYVAMSRQEEDLAQDR